MTPPTPAAPPPVIEHVERSLRWRAGPTLLFLFMLVGLLAVGLVSTLSPPRTARDLPEDEDIAAARALVAGLAGIPAGAYRFRSSLTGDAPADPVVPADAHERLVAARDRLVAALKRLQFDAATRTAAGHAELALRHHRAAEAHYRLAIELAPHYGEARLGLGVTLAIRADATADPMLRRRLRLQAIAQLGAIAENDPTFTCALYNRAVLLDEVGRRDEAEALARRYLSGEGEGAWADRLRARLRLGA